MVRTIRTEIRRTIELKGGSISELLVAANTEITRAEGLGWTVVGVDVFRSVPAEGDPENLAYISLERDEQ
jgi:hypothetical protein